METGQRQPGQLLVQRRVLRRVSLDRPGLQARGRVAHGTEGFTLRGTCWYSITAYFTDLSVSFRLSFDFLFGFLSAFFRFLSLPGAAPRVGGVREREFQSRRFGRHVVGGHGH